MADNHTLARPYAQAVFELAEGRNTLEQWSKALTVAGQIASDDAVLDIIQRPDVGTEQQLTLLSQLAASLGETTLLGGNDNDGQNFLRLVIENDRVPVLPEIAERFEALKAEIEKTVDATVTAASELSEQEVVKIRDALAARLGQRVNVTTAVDPNLIGGAVISAGDFVIDGSVRSRLAKLATALTQ